MYEALLPGTVRAARKVGVQPRPQGRMHSLWSRNDALLGSPKYAPWPAVSHSSNRMITSGSVSWTVWVKNAAPIVGSW